MLTISGPTTRDSSSEAHTMLCEPPIKFQVAGSLKLVCTWTYETPRPTCYIWRLEACKQFVAEERLWFAHRWWRG